MSKRIKTTAVAGTAAERLGLTTIKTLHRTMIHAYKYRLYPNAEQKAYFAKAFGCCRYAYNYYVREHERTYKQEKRMLWEFDLIRARPML